MSRLRWPDSTNSVSDDPGTVHGGYSACQLALYLNRYEATRLFRMHPSGEPKHFLLPTENRRPQLRKPALYFELFRQLVAVLARRLKLCWADLNPLFPIDQTAAALLRVVLVSRT